MPSFGLGWAFNFGGGSGTFTSGQGVATDAAGNVYAAGFFGGTVDFDPNQTNPNGTHVLTANDTFSDAFVAKYAADGTFQWVADIGAGGARKLAVGGSSVYVPYGGGVVRLDAASGAMTWATTVASGGFTAQVAIDSAGNVDVTGGTAASQAFVAQLDPAGNVRWTRTASGGGANGVAADASGNVYATGGYTGTVTFGTKSLTSWNNSYPDAFVWKLDANGGTTWAGSVGSVGGDSGQGVAVDGGGNVLVTGLWGGSFDAAYNSRNNNFNPNSGGPVKLTSHGGNDVFVTKLAQGNKGALTLAWAKDIGGAGIDQAYDVAADAGGNVYTTGFFMSPSVNFNPNSGTPYVLQAYGPTDVFVSELSAAGGFVAAAHFGGPAANTGRDNIAVDGSGNVYLTGRFDGTVNFSPSGTYNLTYSGSTKDGFVSKLTQTSPLLAATGPATGTKPGRLTDAQLQPILAAAIDRWAAAGLDAARLDVMRHASVTVANLGASYLGLADPGTHAIRIDDDAAGYGWFVDATPGDDKEFAEPVRSVRRKMDLLSAVTHELGHIVGLDDDHDSGHASDVMGDSLATGTRRMPTIADVSSAKSEDNYSVPHLGASALARVRHRR